ncbi:MAG: magnesium transporter CorA family protein [Enterococcus sp.]
MIHYLSLKEHQLTKQEKEDAQTIWYLVEDPSFKEIDELTHKFNMRADYITSILDDAENSRTEDFLQEEFTHPALLLLQYPELLSSPSGYLQLNTYPFSIVITPQKKIITIMKHEPQFLKKVMTHFYENNDISNSLKIFFQLMWEITISYNYYLATIRKQCDLLESQLQVATENSQLYQMMDIQKSLVYFEQATTSNMHALQKIASHPTFEKNHGLKNHFHDILIETEQAMTSSKIQLKLVDQMNSTFSAIVSNNLNNIMKILTSLTIVLTIPTIIGGLYGMNVKLPFAGRDDAFFWIGLITILICILSIRYLKKKHLL